MRRTLLLPALTLCALGLAGCSGDEPVGTLTVEPKAVRLGYPAAVKLRFAWQPAVAIESDRPLVFVHLLDQPGSVLRTFDHPLPRPWRPGEPIEYEIELYQSALGSSIPPGSYQLTVGLYEPEGERWPLAGAGQEVARREYAVAGVEVPGAGGGPTFSFSEAWLPPEPGRDAQVLGRRWLTSEGAIKISGATAPGAALLVLTIPAADGSAGRLVVEEGSNVPSVVLRSTCGGVETAVSGPGTHKVEMPVEASAEAGGACEIRLRPSFHLVEEGSPVRRSVVLENLAWMAGR